MSDLSISDAAEKSFNLAVNSLMKRARQEILDDLLRGKDVGKYTFEGLLDCALQEDFRYKSLLTRVADYVINNEGFALYKWVRARLAEQITEDMVRERAEHLAECEEEMERSYQGE